MLRSELNVLMTGGLGFIGSNLVCDLGKRGYEVWACDLKYAEMENYVRCDVGRFPALSRWEMLSVFASIVLSWVSRQIQRTSKTNNHGGKWRMRKYESPNMTSNKEVLK